NFAWKELREFRHSTSRTSLDASSNSGIPGYSWELLRTPELLEASIDIQQLSKLHNLFWDGIPGIPSMRNS
ncbi:unnamed protein product, partial [Didymodactylos carnosus]